MSYLPEYVLVLLFATVMDYFLAIRIASIKDYTKRKLFLVFSIFSNLGLLFVFKYFNFFGDSLRSLLSLASLDVSIPYSSLILPLGLSFHTFQSLGYMIEVYRGEIKPQKHFGIFALYIAFFPQLVAGPIERAKNLIPQFYVSHKFDFLRIVGGLKIVLWGFFLKAVLADRLAVPVDYAFTHPSWPGGISLLLATIFFAFQIYGDFAGYTFIAIGTAKIMGFSLMDNFRRPYLSGSFVDFWRRWHISLSSWFRDYLYIPLGGSKKGFVRTLVNLFIVFLLSGLWHGAAWTFVIWGIIHGLLVIGNTLVIKLSGKKKKVKHNFGTGIINFFKSVFVFSFVCFAWIFFRANSVSDALIIIKRIFSWTAPKIITLSLTSIDLSIAVFLILFVMIVDFFTEKRFFGDKTPWWAELLFYLLVFWFIIILGSFGGREFIYFQF